MDKQRSSIRCAIYTRKSTEEGLEQEFNSLDAQREAAEAYIRSQRLAGWVTTSSLYNDGGFSGASMDRPALRQLLADVEAGKVDCVVVYKVDRLSRSLLDFSRLIELFDRSGVSFVSVTQEFNSTTSLGRLTLNILLSFAQFEREIIGERTRDKIAAARRKGKWMGGAPVLGYDADSQTRRLVINEDEAARVRRIFEIASKADSLNTTVAAVDADQLMTKEYTSKNGTHHAARRFNTMTLRRLLSNVMYTGVVFYKGSCYPGEHPPIIDRQAWEVVNEQLGLRSIPQRRRSHRKQDALLCQLLYCGECGASMTSAYAVKGGQQYRYYVCTTARRSRRGGCAQRQVAAADLEPSVIRHLEPILGTQLSAPIIHQAVERITYETITRRVTIRLRAGTKSEYSLPEPIRRGARRRTAEETSRVPRISRVMALAIRMERLVGEGSVNSYRHLAEKGQISVPRLSQILRLLDLAPSIQEQLLFLPPTMNGVDAVTERDVRALARVVDWERQQNEFRALMNSRQPS